MAQERAVMISVAVSIGMIVLSVVGWWLWQAYPKVVDAVLFWGIARRL
jgi:hypothetical protein